MAVPQVNDPAAYIIYRDVPAGEPYDATSALSFFPPKGSDELFDALRLSFPHLKTHSERMRDAIIQFLLEERQVEQFELSPATTMESSQLTWPSASSGSTSNFSSPDLLNYATPASFSSSPQIQEAPQPSTAMSYQSSPPSLDQMTGVFSLSSNPQPKQRVRRKMTDAEKIEYRKRRIVKACDKCAKRKRKCPHNQAEMKTVPTPTISTKSNSPQSTLSTHPAPRPSNPSFPQTFDGNFDPSSFGGFDDFNMFDDPLPEASVDDFFHFEHFEDSNTLFDTTTHDPFAPSHMPRQYSIATRGAQYSGAELLSHRIPLHDRNENPSAEFPTFPSLDLPAMIPDSQTQAHNHPSQRAVRDLRTDGPLSSSRITIEAVENHPGSTNVDPLRSSNAVLRAIRGRPSLTSSDDRTPMLSDQTLDTPGRQSQVIGSCSHRELATTSTSVSMLSESSAQGYAALQGRPQSTRLTKTPVVATQAADSSEGSRREASLGEGICRSDNLATELYMLRRRLPAMRRPVSHTNRADIANVAAKTVDVNIRSQQSPEQLSAQANGGLGNGILRTVREKSGLLQTNDRAQGVTRRSTNGLAAGAHDASPSQNIALALAVPSNAGLVYQDRLSDHVRYRDHHGRPEALGLPQLAYALGALALLAMFLPGISALCAAFLLTTQSSGMPEGIVKCTSKNSSWLSACVRNSRSDVEFRVLKKRQYIRGGGSQAGLSLFEAGPNAWLCGLMDPYRLTPVFTFG